MWRSVTTTVGVGLASLVVAGAAAAKVSFDPVTQTGFISRGDVIAAAGKAGLIAEPFVTFRSTTSYTLTCTLPDQTQARADLARDVFIVFHAKARYSPGGNTITGYSFTHDDIVDAGVSPPFDDRFICLSLLGIVGDSTPVDLQYSGVSDVDTLTYFAPGGAVELPFKTD